MFKSISIKVIPLLAVCAVMLAACSKDEESATPSAAVSAGSELLQYVPADSPYVFVTLEPISDDVMDSLEPKLDRVLASYQAVLKEVVAAKMAELSAEEQDSEEAQRVEAFVDEFATLLSVDGMRGAGIARESLGAFYGNGLLPVMRIELSDEALFEAAVARLEERAGHEMPVGEVQGQPYRYFDLEELRIVVAVLGNQAVFAIVPSVFDESQTGRALGLTLPESSIADTSVLQDIISKYDFTNHVVAFIDVPAIAERFVGEPTGLDADLLALMGGDKPQLSDVCKTEIRELAGVAPRMVIGYTGITATQFDSSIVFELRQDIASGLTALATAVPGLGGDRGGLMSFGFSLDIKAAREFMEARLDAMEADPYECEHLAELQAGVASGRQSLNQPVPPMIYDFKGFVAVIDDIEGLDIATQTPPTSVDGGFLLAMDNAQALVAMGAMFSPELAALNLQADGNPVELNLPQLQMMGISAFAALEEGALVLSMGEDAESQVTSMLAADASAPPPFMSFSVDAARYYSFMGEAIAAGDAGADDAATPEMQAAMTEMMQSIADLYDRMSVDVLFTENGIEMHATEILKE
jgi:hypothetical protein